MARYYHLKEIDSTSSYLKRNYEQYENMTFVSADYQSNGHGRNNRQWISKNKENLLFSLLIKDEDLIKKYDKISLSSAVCIYKILNKLNIENITIKWPNDVFVNDSKIAGILLESVSSGDKIQALVLGVGINVNSSKFSYNLINSVTSICLETNKKWDLDKLKNLVYSEFLCMLNNINGNDNSYLEIIRNNNYLKGKMVYAIINDKKVLTQVIDVNDDNSLKVKLEDKYLNIYSGEITFHL